LCEPCHLWGGSAGVGETPGGRDWAVCHLGKACRERLQIVREMTAWLGVGSWEGVSGFIRA